MLKLIYNFADAVTGTIAGIIYALNPNPKVKPKVKPKTNDEDKTASKGNLPKS